MPIIEELDPRQIEKSLAEAVSRQVPVSLTCKSGSIWLALRTRILARDTGGLVLAWPTDEQGGRPDLPRSVPLGLSFKIKHHKHLFNGLVEGADQRPDEEGRPVEVLRVPAPLRMQRVQRRAYQRVDVPRSRSVLATFWEGGLVGADAAQQRTGFSWEGWLTDLSAGGFQVRLVGKTAPQLEGGDAVGVRIDLGQEFKPILADAQFRHQVNDRRGVVLLGFQFVGLNQSPAGRETLARIGRVVCEFQRLAGRRRGRANDHGHINEGAPAWRAGAGKSDGEG